MRPKTVLALFVLVAALLAFIWFYERELPSSDERGELARKAFVFDRDAVDRIELEIEGEHVRMVKIPTEDAAEQDDEDSVGFFEDDWQLESPFQGRADTELVTSLLDTVESLEKVRELTGLAPSEAGLEAPRATLRLHTDEGSREILVGSEVPASETMIVRLDGGEPTVVSSSLWSSLDLEPGDWRSKDLYLGERDAIESVVLNTEQATVRLARRGDLFWIEEPLTDLADRERARSLLGTIVGLRVDRFVDQPHDAAADLGLDPPFATVEVSTQDGTETFRLDWGRPVAEDGTKSLARVSGQVFETSAPMAEFFALSPEAWRSLDLTTFETHQVDSIRVVDGEGELSIQRAGADWQRDNEKISFTAVSDLLYSLVEAKASGTREAGDIPSEEGGRVGDGPVITLSDGQRDETLMFRPIAGDQAAVSSGEREVLLVLTADVFGEIQQKLDEVRAAEPLGSEESPSNPEISADSLDESR